LRGRLGRPARRPRLRGPPAGPRGQPAPDLQRPAVPDRRGAPAAGLPPGSARRVGSTPAAAGRSGCRAPDFTGGKRREVKPAAALLLLAAGCGKTQASLPPPLPPRIDVESPTLRYVTEYEYFTGRTEAADMVEIRARVSGYLTTAPVARSEAKNGEVKEGDDV